MSDTVITLESLSELYRCLPPAPPPMSLLVPVQAEINQSLSMQLEQAGIPIYRSTYLPTRSTYTPRRSHYETRRGYEHARRYWRSVERNVRRMARQTAYLIRQETARLDA